MLIEIQQFRVLLFDNNLEIRLENGRSQVVLADVFVGKKSELLVLSSSQLRGNCLAIQTCCSRASDGQYSVGEIASVAMKRISNDVRLVMVETKSET